MTSKINHCSGRISNEMPAVKVCGIEHGVNCEQEERLDLRIVSWRQCIISVLEGLCNIFHAALVVGVLQPAALRRVPDGQDHVHEPVIRVFDGALVLLIHVVQNGEECRLGEAGEEAVNVGHEVLHNGVCGLSGR